MFCVWPRHPDKNLDNQENAKVMFQKVHASYTRLTVDEESEDEDDDYDDFMYQDAADEARAFFEFLYVPSDLPAPSTFLHPKKKMCVVAWSLLTS
jgi:hypothetical protein